MLKGVHALTDAASRKRVPESPEQSQDGGSGRGQENSDRTVYDVALSGYAH